MIDIKIDTKEKFTVITPLQEVLYANLADEVLNLLNEYQNKEVPHIILNFTNVKKIDADVLERIFLIQTDFYDKNISFVICCINKEIEENLEKMELLEIMNITPTESEAWDIVLMEEIERELLGDE